MMNSKVFDPPVYKGTYESGLTSSEHRRRQEMIRCCGVPCWLQILIWSMAIVLVSIGVVMIHRKYFYNPNLSANNTNLQPHLRGHKIP